MTLKEVEEGKKVRLLARVLSLFVLVMTQPGKIDGVMKQITQSFNPVIHRRIQETMRNPTVVKWLALPHRVVLR